MVVFSPAEKPSNTIIVGTSRWVRRNVRGSLNGAAAVYHRLERLVDPVLMLIGVIGLPAIFAVVLVWYILQWYVLPIQVIIAAGDVKGESYAIAQALAGRLHEKYGNVRVVVQETPGTEENLRRLRFKTADVAAAQADVALDEWIRPKSGTQMSGGVIAALHLDKFQLLLCPEPLTSDNANSRAITDFAAVVPAGEALARRDRDQDPIKVHLPLGGGQQASFERMAAKYRLHKGDDYLLDDDSGKPTARCEEGEYGNLVFRVRAEGNKGIAEAIDLGWRLVDLPNAASVWSSSRALSRSSIPAGRYRAAGPLVSVPEPVGDTQTIAVPRLFVARDNTEVPHWLLYEMTRILNVDGAALARLAEGGERDPEQIRNLFLDIPHFNSKTRLSTIGIPLHPDSASFYDPTLTWSNWLSQHAEALSLLLAFIGILVSGLIALNRLFVWWRRNNVEDLIERATHEMAAPTELHEPRLYPADLAEQVATCRRTIAAITDGSRQMELFASIQKLVDGQLRLRRLAALFAEAGEQLTDERISEGSFRTFNEAYRAAQDSVLRVIEDEKRAISAHYVARLMRVVKDVTLGARLPFDQADRILNEASGLMSQELVYSRDSFRTLTDAYDLAKAALQHRTEDRTQSGPAMPRG